MLRVRERVRSVILLVVCLLPVAVAAQEARPGRVVVTVTDPSGGVLPGATVTLAGLEASTRAMTTAAGPNGLEARTDDKGVAIFDRAIPGRYTISATFSGFDPGMLRDARARPGVDNKFAIVLVLSKLESSIVVSNDTQEAAADRRERPPRALRLSRDRGYRLPGGGRRGRREWPHPLCEGRIPWDRERRRPQLRHGESRFSASEHGQPMVHRIAVRELSLARL